MQAQEVKIINGEKVEEDSLSSNSTTKNSIDFPAPIGSGRRNRNRNSATEELPDFDFLNNMPNEWGKMTSKITPDQIPGGSQVSVWAPKLPPNMGGTRSRTSSVCWLSKTTQTEAEVEIATESENVIIPTGIYEFAAENFSAEISNNQTTQTEALDFFETQEKPESVDSSNQNDGYCQSLGDLCELFPHLKPDELEYYLTESAGDVQIAINKIIDSDTSQNEASVEEFEIEESVLLAYNSTEDQEEFSMPVTIQDPNLFQQLVDRFGAPDGLSRSNCHSNSMFAAIPLSLAKEIYDWWKVSIMDPNGPENGPNFDQDQSFAQSIQDEEIALQLQEDFMRESEVSESKNEFPPLSEEKSVPFRKPVNTGEWNGKAHSCAKKIKVDKLARLFPYVPVHRLEEILDENQGSMQATLNTLGLMLDKGPGDFAQCQQPSVDPGKIFNLECFID